MVSEGKWTRGGYHTALKRFWLASKMFIVTSSIGDRSCCFLKLFLGLKINGNDPKRGHYTILNYFKPLSELKKSSMNGPSYTTVTEQVLNMRLKVCSGMSDQNSQMKKKDICYFKMIDNLLLSSTVKSIKTFVCDV